MTEKRMVKETVIKEDGRYLIFYSWEPAPVENNGNPVPPAGPSKADEK
jgi:hypothetical protein